MKIKFLFAYYDLWIGFYYDTKKKTLYILPLPMLGITVEFKPKQEKTYRCCGRCDGIEDICVADRYCEHHDVLGCEICFGKRC